LFNYQFVGILPLYPLLLLAYRLPKKGKKEKRKKEDVLTMNYQFVVILLINDYWL